MTENPQSDPILDKQHAIERQKTVRTALWLVGLLIVAGILFFVYRFLTAPVRVAQDTAGSVAETVDEVATQVLSVRHVAVSQGRRFARLSEAAHDALIAYPEVPPADIAERAFRTANLRGSRNKVCRFAMDFGAGPVNVFAAADNDAFATNRAMGGEDERQVRLVFVTDTSTLGLNAQSDAANGWQLLWRRRNAARKPLSDETASARALEALARVPEDCSPE